MGELTAQSVPSVPLLRTLMAQTSYAPVIALPYARNIHHFPFKQHASCCDVPCTRPYWDNSQSNHLQDEQSSHLANHPSSIPYPSAKQRRKQPLACMSTYVQQHAVP